MTCISPGAHGAHISQGLAHLIQAAKHSGSITLATVLLNPSNRIATCTGHISAISFG